MSFPRRRWFRFSLRTLLAAFTAVSLWLGWNLHVVQSRNALLRLINNPRDVRVTESVTPMKPMSAAELRDLNARMNLMVAKVMSTEFRLDQNKKKVEYSPTQEPGVSLLRRWLGDESYDRIIYLVGPDPAEVHRLFPEAIVISARP